jgi:hypothetical protein
MDPTAAAATPTGLTAWILANGQIVAFIAQLLFWLVLGVASIWAAAILNRYVNFMMRDAETTETVEISDAEETVSVEEFVE